MAYIVVMLFTIGAWVVTTISDSKVLMWKNTAESITVLGNYINLLQLSVYYKNDFVFL